MWFPHKFKGPGVRYEVGTSVSSGHIVWVHGPFPCGLYPDLRIFRAGMKNALLPDEKVIADGGYPDECCITPQTVDAAHREAFNRIRARQETANRCLKAVLCSEPSLSSRHQHELVLLPCRCECNSTDDRSRGTSFHGVAQKRRL